jgi:hypothetical protein
MQDEPPDLLSEREDIPPEVGGVVARALAKKPEDRFQTVRDLRLSLTRAAEHRDLSQDLSAEEVQRNKRFANRIIVPTGTEELADDDYEDPNDEVTVVNASPAEMGSTPYVAGGPPRKASIAKSWQLAALALLGVIAIGGILYAMTRYKPASADENTVPLTADPNSQPVKPTGAPTGQAERDILPSSTVNSNVDANLNANTSNTNENQNTELPGDGNNGNTNSDANSNSSNANNSTGTNSNDNKNNNTGGDNPAPKSTPPKVDVGPPPPPPTPSQSNNF